MPKLKIQDEIGNNKNTYSFAHLKNHSSAMIYSDYFCSRL